MINHLSIPQYLLESSFCLAVFYLFYHLFLKKETHFQFNRVYLINAALFSLAIPIINIDFNKATHLSAVDQVFPILSSVNAFQVGIHQTIAQQSNVLHISVADVITWVYYIGFFVMLLKLVSGLFKLFGIINRSPKMKDIDHTLLISNDVPASSFFSYIFWQDKHDRKDEVQKTIMDHEMVHVRQWHSLDVIIMELMVIVKWFNPLIYLFRNSLKQTHEFIADKYVTEKIIDKVSYASILLTNKARTDLPPATNHFYGHIRERVQMLSAEKSTWISQFKYLVAVPVTIALFSLFSFDLSDKLPEPIKNSFHQIENTMLATAGQSVISLNMDEDLEKEKFHLSWGEAMSIVLNQKGETQNFILNYKAQHLSNILSGYPEIIQDGNELHVEIDTIEVLKNNERFSINVKDLQDEDFRNILIDSLNRNDQIIISLKSYSDTDSLRINLHMGIDGPYDVNGQPIDKAEWAHMIRHSSDVIKWGNKKIDFTSFMDSDTGQRNDNWTKYITQDLLDNMLDGIIQVEEQNNNFSPMDMDQNIVITLNRSVNTGLAAIEAEKVNQFESSYVSIVSDVSLLYNNTYSINEVSKKMTLREFYDQKDLFKNWFSDLTDGDNLRISIMDPIYSHETYHFRLVYQDKHSAGQPPIAANLTFLEDSYNYQIVMNNKGKSLIRLDANAPENKSIFDAYSKSESYEIVNISDFKTKTRIFEKRLPTGILEKENIVDYDLLQQNVFELNDHYSDRDKLLRMNWGKMVSMPNNGNYSIKEWKRSSLQNLNLYEGTSQLKMERYDILIIPENGKIKRIRTDKVNTSNLRKTFDLIEPNTSIYIDNIIVNIDGERKFYPYNFVYTVE